MTDSCLQGVIMTFFYDVSKMTVKLSLYDFILVNLVIKLFCYRPYIGFLGAKSCIWTEQ